MPAAPSERTMGAASADDGDRATKALLIGLGAPNRDPETVIGELDVIDVQRHKLGSAEGAAETQREQRAVAEALELAGRGGLDHIAGDFRDRRRLALWGRTDRAANAAQRRLDAFVVRWRFVPGE